MDQIFDRRKFLKRTAQAATLAGLGTLPFPDMETAQKLVILHTNDVHSRIEPFPESAGHLAGKGGAARRSAYIKAVRERNPYVLLLDSGDIWQGTPYFNVFKGGLEFELMSQMKYDASTLGNHDFDLGMEGLLQQWPKAKFPFICTNYDFSNTPLAGKTYKYRILQKGKLRIGLLGLGIKLKGLVPEDLFGGTRYLDPLTSINHWAKHLKLEEKCDYIIVLSHLGLSYRSNGKISDIRLVPQTKYVDLVLGGHSHTFLEQPVVVPNKNGTAVAINQVGFGGAMMGHLELTFDTSRKKKRVNCQNCWL